MISSALSSIRVVLVQTFHPGNIGACARAMKTMGLTELFLVDPCDFPSAEADSRAAGALDILEQATVVGSLSEAITDCTQVFATSARKRGYSRPQNNAEQAAHWIAEHPSEKVAVVFGRERMGLSNEQLEMCQQLVYVPGNPDYDVLNIAQAVQIICYELFKQSSTTPLLATESAEEFASHLSPLPSPQFPPQADTERFYQHLEQTFKDTGFLNQKHPGEAMQRLQQLFSRAQPNAKELRMLRGMLGSVDRLLVTKK